MTYLEQQAKKEERDARIVDWTREGLELPGDRGGDTDVWEDEVWWGYLWTGPTPRRSRVRW